MTIYNINTHHKNKHGVALPIEPQVLTYPGHDVKIVMLARAKSLGQTSDDQILSRQGIVKVHSNRSINKQA